MQRAAARLASVSLRRQVAASPRPDPAVAALWIPAAASVHATARLIPLRPTTAAPAAAAAAALCARRGYARGVNCDEDTTDSEEEMLSELDQDDDFDDEDMDDLDDDDEDDE